VYPANSAFPTVRDPRVIVAHCFDVAATVASVTDEIGRQLDAFYALYSNKYHLN
jgi:hypothetical protein